MSVLDNLYDPNFTPMSQDEIDNIVETRDNGWFGWGVDAFQSGAAGVGRGLADYANQKAGWEWAKNTSDWLGHIQVVNGKRENPTNIDYLTNPQGLFYDAMNATGSSVALAAPATLAALAAPSTGGGSLAAGAGIAASLARGAGAIDKLGKAYMIGKIASTVPEAMSESGTKMRELDETGRYSRDEINGMGNESLLKNMLLLTPSNAVEGFLGKNLLAGVAKKAVGSGVAGSLTWKDRLASAAKQGLGYGALEAGQNYYEEGVQSAIENNGLNGSYNGFGGEYNPANWSKEDDEAAKVGGMTGFLMGGIPASITGAAKGALHTDLKSDDSIPFDPNNSNGGSAGFTSPNDSSTLDFSEAGLDSSGNMSDFDAAFVSEDSKDGKVASAANLDKDTRNYFNDKVFKDAALVEVNNFLSEDNGANPTHDVFGRIVNGNGVLKAYFDEHPDDIGQGLEVISGIYNNAYESKYGANAKNRYVRLDPMDASYNLSLSQLGVNPMKAGENSDTIKNTVNALIGGYRAGKMNYDETMRKISLANQVYAKTNGGKPALTDNVINNVIAPYLSPVPSNMNIGAAGVNGQNVVQAMGNKPVVSMSSTVPSSVTQNKKHQEPANIIDDKYLSSDDGKYYGSEHVVRFREPRDNNYRTAVNNLSNSVESEDANSLAKKFFDLTQSSNGVGVSRAFISVFANNASKASNGRISGSNLKNKIWKILGDNGYIKRDNLYLDPNNKNDSFNNKLATSAFIKPDYFKYILDDKISEVAAALADKYHTVTTGVLYEEASNIADSSNKTISASDVFSRIADILVKSGIPIVETSKQGSSFKPSDFERKNQIALPTTEYISEPIDSLEEPQESSSAVSKPKSKKEQSNVKKRIKYRNDKIAELKKELSNVESGTDKYNEIKSKLDKYVSDRDKLSDSLLGEKKSASDTKQGNLLDSDIKYSTNPESGSDVLLAKNNFKSLLDTKVKVNVQYISVGDNKGVKRIDASKILSLRDVLTSDSVSDAYVKSVLINLFNSKPYLKKYYSNLVNNGLVALDSRVFGSRVSNFLNSIIKDLLYEEKTSVDVSKKKSSGNISSGTSDAKSNQNDDKIESIKNARYEREHPSKNVSSSNINNNLASSSNVGKLLVSKYESLAGLSFGTQNSGTLAVSYGKKSFNTGMGNILNDKFRSVSDVLVNNVVTYNQKGKSALAKDGKVITKKANLTSYEVYERYLGANMKPEDAFNSLYNLPNGYSIYKPDSIFGSIKAIGVAGRSYNLTGFDATDRVSKLVSVDKADYDSYLSGKLEKKDFIGRYMDKLHSFMLSEPVLFKTLVSNKAKPYYFYSSKPIDVDVFRIFNFMTATYYNKFFSADVKPFSFRDGKVIGSTRSVIRRDEKWKSLLGINAGLNPHVQASVALGNALGVSDMKVVSFNSEEDMLHFNGFVMDDVIYINENSQRSPEWVFGHEFAHKSLKVNKKNPLNELMGKLKQTLTEDGYYHKIIDAYAKMQGWKATPEGYVTSDSGTMSPEKIFEEVFADYVGDRVASGRFIDDVADSFVNARGAFGYLLTNLREFLNKCRFHFKDNSKKSRLSDLFVDFSSPDDSKYLYNLLDSNGKFSRDIDKYLSNILKEQINIAIENKTLTTADSNRSSAINNNIGVRSSREKMTSIATRLANIRKKLKEARGIYKTSAKGSKANNSAFSDIKTYGIQEQYLVSLDLVAADRLKSAIAAAALSYDDSQNESGASFGLDYDAIELDNKSKGVISDLEDSNGKPVPPSSDYWRDEKEKDNESVESMGVFPDKANFYNNAGKKNLSPRSPIGDGVYGYFDFPRGSSNVFSIGLGSSLSNFENNLLKLYSRQEFLLDDEGNFRYPAYEKYFLAISSLVPSYSDKLMENGITSDFFKNFKIEQSRILGASFRNTYNKNPKKSMTCFDIAQDFLVDRMVLDAKTKKLRSILDHAVTQYDIKKGNYSRFLKISESDYIRKSVLRKVNRVNPVPIAPVRGNRTVMLRYHRDLIAYKRIEEERAEAFPAYIAAKEAHEADLEKYRNDMNNLAADIAGYRAEILANTSKMARLGKLYEIYNLRWELLSKALMDGYSKYCNKALHASRYSRAQNKASIDSPYGGMTFPIKEDVAAFAPMRLSGRLFLDDFHARSLKDGNDVDLNSDIYYANTFGNYFLQAYSTNPVDRHYIEKAAQYVISSMVRFGINDESDLKLNLNVRDDEIAKLRQWLEDNGFVESSSGASQISPEFANKDTDELLTMAVHGYDKEGKHVDGLADVKAKEWLNNAKEAISSGFIPSRGITAYIDEGDEALKKINLVKSEPFTKLSTDKKLKFLDAVYPNYLEVMSRIWDGIATEYKNERAVSSEDIDKISNTRDASSESDIDDAHRDDYSGEVLDEDISFSTNPEVDIEVSPNILSSADILQANDSSLVRDIEEVFGNNDKSRNIFTEFLDDDRKTREWNDSDHLRKKDKSYVILHDTLDNHIKKGLESIIKNKNKFGLADKFFWSPSRVAGSLSRKFTSKFPALRFLFDLGSYSRIQESRFKKFTGDKFGNVIKSLTDEEKEIYRLMFLYSDVMGKDISDEEARSIGATDNAIKQFKTTRKLMERCRFAINKVNRAIGRPEIGYIGGYYPHHWEAFNLMATKNGKSTPSTYKDYKEAMKAVRDFEKLGYTVKMEIETSSLYGLSKSSDDSLAFFGESNIEDFDSVIVDSETLKEMPDDFFGSPNEFLVHGRVLAQLMKRNDKGGYSDDVFHVLGHYFNSSARYCSLALFKHMSINYFNNTYAKFLKKDNSSNAFDRDYSEFPEAQYAKNFINDVSGNPQAMTKMLDACIESIPPLRNFLIKHSSYGTAYSVGIANNITEFVALTTLGLFNPATACMQLTQVLNASVLCGKNPTLDALKRVLSNKLTTEDKWVIKNSGVEFDAKLNDGLYSKGGKFSYSKKIQSLASKSMYAFEKLDMVSRKVALLAGYRSGIDAGMSREDALAYGVDVNRRCNFDNSIVDSSGLFRQAGVLGQVLLQFKKYGIKQFEFAYDTVLADKDKGERKRFLVAYITLAGMMGIPLMGIPDVLSELLLGKDARSALREYALENTKSGDINPIVQAAIYGASSFSGVDISRRASQDFEILSLPPILSKIHKFIQGVSGGNFNKALTAFSPSLGNVDTALSGHPRGLTGVRYTASEAFFRGLGFIPMREAILRDKQNISKKKNDEAKDNRENGKVKDGTSLARGAVKFSTSKERNASLIENGARVLNLTGINYVLFHTLGIGKKEARVVRVLDGDTVKLDSGETVRMLGVDTPEVAKDFTANGNRVFNAGQKYGEEAKAFTKKKLLNQMVDVVRDFGDEDAYGRKLRFIYLKDGTNFNKSVIDSGFGKVLILGISRSNEFSLRKSDSARRAKYQALGNEK